MKKMYVLCTQKLQNGSSVSLLEQVMHSLLYQCRTAKYDS